MKKADKQMMSIIVDLVSDEFDPKEYTCQASYDRAAQSYARALVVEAMDKGFSFTASRFYPVGASINNVLRNAYLKK